MLVLYALYALPFAIRFGLTAPSSLPPWSDVVLSLLPVVVVFPSSYTVRFLGRRREWEHVVRHAFYSAAFSVSVASSVRWSYVAEHLDVCLPLVLYLAVGCATLWWFVVSHVAENHLMPWLRVHQGDVTVLPLTLVAIATFARDLPDDAVRFSRAVLFFVPVIVAWATIFFIAYNGFARGRVTTFHEDGFDFHARSALVVASAHLGLLECNSPPTVFQFFPIVAALLCQTTALHTDAPRLRPRAELGTLLTSLGVGAGAGAVLWTRFGWRALVCVAVLLPIVARALPTLAGDRWVVPGSAYLSLGVVAYLIALSERGVVAEVRAVDTLAVTALAYLACFVVQFLARPVWTPEPPATPPATTARRPQEDAPCWAPSRLFRIVVPLGRCVGTSYTENTPAELLRRHPPHPHCPEAYRGVWWMDGNTFPVDLVVVQDARWSADGRTAWRFDADGITHDASLFGVLLWLWTKPKRSRLDVLDREWIRTCAWYLPVLRWMHVTYWIRVVDRDHMERLVLSSDGRVVWRYSLRRVVRADGSHTEHHAGYWSACAGRRYVM